MTATKQKSKPLYHSDLCKASYAMQIRSDSRDGKYGPYTFVRIYGEDEDRLLNLENDKVRAQFDEMKQRIGTDRWVVVKGAGTKDSATVMFEDSDGSPVLDGEPTQPADAAFPPPNTEGEAIKKASAMDEAREEASNGMAGAYLDCLRAARIATDQYRDEFGDRPTDELMRIATTLFIQRSR